MFLIDFFEAFLKLRILLFPFVGIPSASGHETWHVQGHWLKIFNI